MYSQGEWKADQYWEDAFSVVRGYKYYNTRVIMPENLKMTWSGISRLVYKKLVVGPYLYFSEIMN